MRNEASLADLLGIFHIQVKRKAFITDLVLSDGISHHVPSLHISSIDRTFVELLPAERLQSTFLTG
jgi:hypothetical protein